MISGKVYFSSFIGFVFKVGLNVLLWMNSHVPVWVCIIATIICVLDFAKDIFVCSLVGSESVKSNSKYKWYDRKRIAFFGLPWTFTRYYLTGEKLIVNKGLFNTKEDEVKLYRITDFVLNRKFWQKIFGLGTLEVKSSDKSTPTLVLQNIKRSSAVKELISDLVEHERDRKRVTGREIINNHDHECDHDFDHDVDENDSFDSTENEI